MYATSDAGPAGRRPPRAQKLPRPRPPTFERAYIENGFDLCEEIFQASPQTVKRWLIEAGREQLVKARAAFVAQERAARQASGIPREKLSKAVFDGIAVAPPILAAAASWLRTMRNGGWFCAPTGQGDWWLGLMRKTPAQLVEFARCRGFDAEAAATSTPAAAEPGKPRSAPALFRSTRRRV